MVASFQAFCSRLQSEKERRLHASVYLNHHDELQVPANVHKLLESAAQSNRLEEVCLDHFFLRGQPFEKLLRPSVTHLTSKWSSNSELGVLLTRLPEQCPSLSELVLVTHQPEIDQNEGWIHLLRESRSLRTLEIRVLSRSRSDATTDLRMTSPLAEGLEGSAVEVLTLFGISDRLHSSVCVDAIPRSHVSSLSLPCKNASQAHAIRRMISHPGCPVRELRLLTCLFSADKNQMAVIWTELAVGLGSNSSLELMDASRFSMKGIVASNTLLRDSLLQHSRLKSLTLSLCRTSERDLVELVQCLPPSLEVLDLSRTQITCSTILTALADTLVKRRTPLRLLNLHGACFVDTLNDVTALSRVILQGNLQQLDLGQIHSSLSLRNEVFSSITNAVRNCRTLECLRVDAWEETHIYKLLKEFRQGENSLRTLIVGGSSLSHPQTGQALKQATQGSSSLCELDLTGCDISEGAVAGLAEGISLPSSELHTLRLSLPAKCSMSTIKSFFRALASSSQIRVLELRGNSMLRRRSQVASAVEWWTELCRALPHVTALRSLIVDDAISGALAPPDATLLLTGMEQNVWLESVQGLRLCTPSQDRLNYWLALNRTGRRILREDSSSAGLLNILLARASSDASALYYFLRQSPRVV